MGAMTAALLGLAAVVCKARSHDSFCRIVPIAIKLRQALQNFALDYGLGAPRMLFGVSPQNILKESESSQQSKNLRIINVSSDTFCYGEISMILTVSQILRRRKTQ